MMNAVHHPNLIEVEWAYPLQASDIHAILIRIRSSLVVSIDTAPGTEIMLR
jgi:hypothetical protein